MPVACDIKIGKSSSDAKILLDGIDVTMYVQKIHHYVDAGHIARVDLNVFASVLEFCADAEVKVFLENHLAEPQKTLRDEVEALKGDNLAGQDPAEYAEGMRADLDKLRDDLFCTLAKDPGRVRLIARSATQETTPLGTGWRENAPTGGYSFVIDVLPEAPETE